MRTYTFFRVVKNVYLNNGKMVVEPTGDPLDLLFDHRDKFVCFPSSSKNLAELNELGAIRIFFRLPHRLIEPIFTLQDYYLEWKQAAKPSRTHMALLIAAAVITLCIMLTGIIAPIVYFCR